MTPPSTFVATLVRTLRVHAGRPAGATSTPTWGGIAAEARDLALGLRLHGLEGGTRVRLGPVGDGGQAARVLRELAVLSAGGVIVLDDDRDDDRHDDRDGARAHADPVLDDGGLDGATLTTLLADGRSDRSGPPDGYETRVAAIDSDAPAVVAGDVTVTQAELQWALRSVERWLVPVVSPWGPGRVLATVGRDGSDPAPVTAALVGRWWPAIAGGRLVDPAPGQSLPAAIEATGAALVVADAAGWAEVADVLRGRAARSRRATALLRRGRLVAAGEALGAVEEVARRGLARRTGPKVRARAGLDHLDLGLSLGALDPATGRDLAALGVPVVPTWVDRQVPAPVAAGAVVHPWPAGRWGRPLPGRSIECGGPTTTVRGGDVPDGDVVLDLRTGHDARDRVELQ